MHVLRQQLFGALVGLSRASESKEILESSGIALVHGLALAYDPVWESENMTSSEDFDVSKGFKGSEAFQSSVVQIIRTLHAEKAVMAPDCAACQYPCGRTADYDMAETLEASDALRNAKLHLFALLGKIALRAQEHEQGYGSKEIWQFLSDALFQISCTYEAGQLQDLLTKASQLARNK